MRLSPFACQNLAPIVTGESYSPRRSGPDLVKFFNSFGLKDVYDHLGLPENPTNGQRFSRTRYVENRLISLSGNANLRLLLERVVQEAESKSHVAEKINEIISPEGFRAVESGGVYSIQGGVIDRTPPVRNEAHFQDIQSRILIALDDARVSIWVVMAWFTNEILFKKLLEKRGQGIDVKLAIYEDGVNRAHGVDFSRIPHTPLRRGMRGGLMHDKFCVIDNQIVITGSYNWTNNAETRNDENVTVLRDPTQASAYSEEFRRLTT